MELKYDITIDDDVIRRDLERITNQIYKVLPNRDAGIDCVKPLETLII